MVFKTKPSFLYASSLSLGALNGAGKNKKKHYLVFARGARIFAFFFLKKKKRKYPRQPLRNWIKCFSFLFFSVFFLFFFAFPCVGVRWVVAVFLVSVFGGWLFLSWGCWCLSPWLRLVALVFCVFLPPWFLFLGGLVCVLWFVVLG